MLNSVCLMGRLTADPELKTTPNGVSVCRFRVAVSRSYAPKGQERPTDFIPVVAWRSTAEFVSRYFRKGQMMALQGSLQSHTGTDRDGSTRTFYEVVTDNVFFCEKREADRQQQAAELLEEAKTAGPTIGAGYDGEDFEELTDPDEIPF